jgi:hypothetical protein
LKRLETAEARRTRRKNWIDRIDFLFSVGGARRKSAAAYSNDKDHDANKNLLFDRRAAGIAAAD